jgi:N-acetylneuraminic acid mutarotase
MKKGDWIKLKTGGQCFSPRTGHEVIYYKKHIYLFGGTDDDDRKNDLFSYNVFQNRWEKLVHHGHTPNPRSGAKGVAYKGSLYFFGGY